MPLLSRIATIAFVVALPLLLVTLNVRILTSEPRFQEWGFRRYDADVTTGIALAELDRAAGEIVDYFENDADTLRIVVVENGEEGSLFNARETAHMEDVKGVVRAVYRVNEVALGFVLVYIAATVLWSGERSPRRLARETLIGVGVGAVVVLGVGAFALTGFEAAWDRFHEIVFSNDFWRLDPDTDHLIQMFPEAFWEDATFIVAALTLAEAVVLVIAATAYLALTRERSRPAADGGPAPEPGEPAFEPPLPPQSTSG